MLKLIGNYICRKWRETAATINFVVKSACSTAVPKLSYAMLHFLCSLFDVEFYLFRQYNELLTWFSWLTLIDTWIVQFSFQILKIRRYVQVLLTCLADPCSVIPWPVSSVADLYVAIHRETILLDIVIEVSSQCCNSI